MTIHLRPAPTLEDRLDTVTAVHERHKARLRALTGVTTTAVAVEADGEVVISVYAALYAIVPAEVEGVRIVRRQATGGRSANVMGLDCY